MEVSNKKEHCRDSYSRSFMLYMDLFRMYKFIL